MENTTTINVPKKYEGMIKLIEKDSEGYWAYTEEGFYFEDMDAHTAHEYTQKDLLAMIRTIKECECHDCKGIEEEEETEETDEEGKNMIVIDGKIMEVDMFMDVDGWQEMEIPALTDCKVSEVENGFQFTGYDGDQKITSFLTTEEYYEGKFFYKS